MERSGMNLRVVDQGRGPESVSDLGIAKNFVDTHMMESKNLSHQDMKRCQWDVLSPLKIWANYGTAVLPYVQRHRYGDPYPSAI